MALAKPQIVALAGEAPREDAAVAHRIDRLVLVLTEFLGAGGSDEFALPACVCVGKLQDGGEGAMEAGLQILLLTEVLDPQLLHVAAAPDDVVAADCQVVKDRDGKARVAHLRVLDVEAAVEGFLGGDAHWPLFVYHKNEDGAVVAIDAGRGDEVAFLMERPIRLPLSMSVAVAGRLRGSSPLGLAGGTCHSLGSESRASQTLTYATDLPPMA